MASIQMLLLVAVVVIIVTDKVCGHGMLWDPPNRSSLWRFDPTAPVNYDDNENYCGGFGNHWNVHKGKCGVCGDNYGDKIPRENENTGKYGTGKIVDTYTSGTNITVNIKLTANHGGWFSYSLCNLQDSTQPEVDACFQPLLFEDGSKRFRIDSSKFFNNRLQLPVGLKCEHCVLRWNYKTANTWGICEDGSGGMGCGPQETFRSCSDITIV